MSVFGITLIVAVILFIREEILSSFYRKELQRANEEYEAYCRSLKQEALWEQCLLEQGAEQDCLEGGQEGGMCLVHAADAQGQRGKERIFPAA